MISHLVSRSSRTLPRRADRARQAARRRSVFMLERVEDRTLLSTWIGGSSGNWSDAGNWDDGVPSATNPAIISDSATVYINVSNAAAKHVTLSNGAKLEGGSLSVRGNFTVDAGSSFNIGTVTFAGNGTRDVEISNSDAGFTNVVINIPDNGLLTFKGDTNISDDLTFTKLSRIKAGALNLGGNLTSNVASFSGSGTVVFVGDGDQTINADGATGLVPGLAFNKTGGSVAIESDPLRILGGWDVRESNTGEIDLTETTIQFVGQGSRTIDAGGLRFNDVHFGISDQGILTVVGALPIDGNLSIGKSFKGISGGDITVQGNIYTESGTSSMGSGVITLTGNKTQVISSGADGGSLLGLTFAKSGGSVTIASGSNLRLSRGLLVDQPSNIPFTATGGTIQFHATYTKTIDTGYATLGNVVFNINGQAGITIENNLKIGGDLTIKSADKINGPLGAITVAGNLTSTANRVGGGANITMVGADGKTITGGDFPDGGVVIKKGGNNVTANVTTPLDGPLVIDSVGAFGGSFAVGRDVTINTGSISSWNGGKLVFAAGANQNVIVNNGGRLPGVEIAKTGGTLNLPTAIDVQGHWKYVKGNVNTAGSTVKFIGGDKSVNTTGENESMAFNNVVIDLGGNSLNASWAVAPNMIVGGNLTLVSVNNVGGEITVFGNVETSATANVGSNRNGRILFSGDGDQTLTATAKGGRVPGVEINKGGGSLTIAGGNRIDATGNWNYIRGTVDTTGSTVKFIGGDKSVNTTSDNGGMAFNNVELDIDSLNASSGATMIVDGKLTLTRAGAIGGVIEARGDVDTGVTAYLYSARGGKILFNGSGDQTLKATAKNGRVPGVEINKESGSLTIDRKYEIDVTGNWKYIKGTVIAATSTTASTVRFIGGDKTVDTGLAPHNMTFGNVKIDLGVNSLTATNLAVGGALRLVSVASMHAAPGKITVGGDLVSDMFMGSYGVPIPGNAEITMVGGDNPDAPVRFRGNAFPMGGIIIDKGPNGSVDASVSYLAPTLHLKSLGSLTGKLSVKNNVRTSSKAIYGNSDFTRVLIFSGGADQTLTADVHKGGVASSIPGVLIEKSGGTLTIGSRSGNDVTYSTIVVTGSWIVSSNNKGFVDVGEGATGSTIKFGVNGTPMSPTIDTGRASLTKTLKGMRFNNVEFNVHSVKGVVTIEKMVVDGTLTLGGGSAINGGDIEAYGDVVTKAASGMNGDSRIRFLGGKDQTLLATANDRRMPGVIINKTNGALTIGATVDGVSHSIGVTGNWDYLSGNVQTAGSTIRFLDGDKTINAGSMEFDNVGIAPGSRATVTIDADAPMIVNGRLAFGGIETLHGTIEARGDVATGATNFKTSPTGAVLFAGSDNQYLQATKNFAQLPNVVIDKSGGALMILGEIGVTGNWKYIGAGQDVDAGDSTVRFAYQTEGDTTIVDSGAMVFGNVDLYSRSANTLEVLGAGMIVGGDLTITKIGSIVGVIEARGDVTTNDKTVGGSGAILFSGDKGQKLTAGIANGQVPGVKIAKTGGVLTIGEVVDGDPQPISVTGNWEYTGDGCDVDASKSALRFLSGDVTIDSGLMVFGNVELATGKNSVVTVLGNSMIVDGELTIANIGSLEGVIEARNNVTAKDTDVAGSGAILFAGSHNQTLSGVGYGQLPNVKIRKTGLGVLKIDGNVGVSGNWEYSGLGFNVNAAGSTVRFAGDDAQISSGLMAFGNVDLRGEKTSTVTVNGAGMIVGGNLTITRIESLEGTILALRDVTTNDTTVGGSGTIFFTGSGDQNFSAGVKNGQVPNVRILKTGGKLTIGDSHPISVSGNWAYHGFGRDVDATGSKIKFMGGDKTIRSGLMVFYDVDFAVDKGSELKILAPITNRPGTLRYAGEVTKKDRITSGEVKKV